MGGHMYKVLLVDDEIWSLKGIRKLFEWEKMGFTVIAQVTDASEAFDIICSTEPDVVVTDIRMPEISGIQLLNMSRQKGITSEFVIISGFAEFEYAQEALRFGAFDYQLKPIDPDEAWKLLEKLILHLEQKQIAKDMAFFKDLTKDLNNPLETLKQRHFIAHGKYWQVITLSGRHSIDEFKSLLPFTNVNHAFLQIEKQKTLLILNSTHSLDKHVQSLIDKGTGKTNVSIGISSISDDVVHMARLIRESDMAVSNLFIDGKRGVTQFTSNRSIEIESITVKAEKWLMQKKYTEVCSTIDSILDIFKKENLGTYHVTCLWNQFAIMMSKRLDSDSLMTRIDFLDHVEILNRFDNLTEMCAFIKEMLKNICYSSDNRTVSQNKYNRNFITLLEYVNENYDKDLSLSELAEKYFLNVSYCSELFKKVSGYKYSDYVTKLRMESAADLIQTGKYTADKVCDMTGYNDYYYFCKVFKKFYGTTPSQFTAKIN